MIIRDGKATYDTDTNTFSFTFTTAEGEETVVLTNGKLRKAKVCDLGQLYRYAYFYSSYSSEKARKAFERHIYGLGTASRADARFLAKYAVEALDKVAPLADFDAMCCRTYHADGICRDLADEINKHGELEFLTENDKAASADKVLVLDNRPRHFGLISDVRLRYKESTLVMLSAIPELEETAYCGRTLIGCEGYITNPEKLPLAELIGRYAKEHKDGFTVVVPHCGDLDEAVGEIVERQGINAVMMPRNPESITSSELYEECVYNHVFRHHYEGREDEALQKLWDFLHYDDLDGGEHRWHTFFEARYIEDEEMREVVGQALAASEEESFKDCRLINGHDVLFICDKTFHVYDQRTLSAYTPKSLLPLWV